MVHKTSIHLSSKIYWLIKYPADLYLSFLLAKSQPKTEPKISWFHLKISFYCWQMLKMYHALVILLELCQNEFEKINSTWLFSTTVKLSVCCICWRPAVMGWSISHMSFVVWNDLSHGSIRRRTTCSYEYGKISG